MKTEASAETYCPDHFGHVLTRSGYCIFGQHRPDVAGVKLAVKAEKSKAQDIHLVHKETEVETVLDEATIQIGDGAPIPFAEFERRVDALTGELSEPGQMTLGAMFKQYEAPNVRVNSSGGHVLSLETLRDMTEGKPLVPGMAVECTFTGYICGAGLKWKKGGEGKEANLNINLDDLLILRVMGEAVETDPEQDLQDWEDEQDD